jgi:transcription initiation factor IIE alpha subunit
MIPSAMIDDLIDEAVDAKMRKLADDLLAMGKLTDDEISAVSGIPKEKLRENKG